MPSKASRITLPGGIRVIKLRCGARLLSNSPNAVSRYAWAIVAHLFGQGDTKTVYDPVQRYGRGLGTGDDGRPSFLAEIPRANCVANRLVGSEREAAAGSG